MEAFALPEGLAAWEQIFSSWEWWAIGGILLLLAEIFLPGALLLWPGLAALAVAVLAWMLAPPWQLNLILFALFSLASAFFWRQSYLGRARANDQPGLNQRGQQLVGRVCVLVEDTSDTQGRAQIGDTSWSARTAAGASPLQRGTRVRVERVDGTVLVVAPLPHD